MKEIFEVCAEEFDDYLRLVEVKVKYGGVSGGVRIRKFLNMSIVLDSHWWIPLC